MKLIPIALALACAGPAFPSRAQPPDQAPAAARSDNQRCLNCHGQPAITTYGVEERRSMVALGPGEAMPARENLASLLVDRDEIRQGLHADLSCTACHQDAATLPHPPRLKPPQCASCHPQAADDVLRSRHAEAALRSDPPAPRCWDCHGTHVIWPKTDRRSRVYPLEVIKTCGDCHAQHMIPEGDAATGGELVRGYLDGVHGRTVARAGLVVGATCADCHGHHEILPSSHPGSRVNRANIPQTCGRCHVGIDEAFEETVHAEAARRGDSTIPPPVCSDCHSSHRITHAQTPEFMRDIVLECGSCHRDLYRTYRESYHGQVQQLGSARAAKCSDCHGTHNIRRVDDPASTMHADHRAHTCARCHEELDGMSAGTRANFIRYAPHADFRDKDSDPILYYVWLYFLIIISVTFTFWGLHSIAWFVRGTLERVRSGPQPKHAPGGPMIQRFSVWHRCTHVLVMISFMGLTLTGVPLKFSDEPWAAGLTRFVGGVEYAGVLHRCFAVMVLAYLVMHVVHLWRHRAGGGRPLVRRLLGPHSMAPLARDWREFTQMVRWFFGRGPKPRFDRWTYWEKFDYWADMIGTMIIGLSGLLLWFPALFSTFLSGYWFNVATLVHGYEALLAVGFIFSIHFFNAHIRWEKFPVDKVIFTGQLPEEEFREERPAQYERLVQTGQLERLRTPPAPKWVHRTATAAAILALSAGVALVLLIVWASLK